LLILVAVTKEQNATTNFFIPACLPACPSTKLDRFSSNFTPIGFDEIYRRNSTLDEIGFVL
jgi:hypothetical protein